MTCCENRLCGVIHPSVKIGEGVRFGHCVVIEENCEIGNDSYIGNFVVMRSKTKIGSHCKIGHWVVFEGNGRVGSNVTIMPHGQICLDAVIEDSVFIGPMYIGLNDPNIDFKKDYYPPIIRRGARIGGGVILMPGIEIGEDSFVAAGSVVTKNVPPNNLVMGMPAVFKRVVNLKKEEEIL